MRTVSDAELWRQISRNGRRWGLVPMWSVFGEVLVGERISVRLPLGGISAILRVNRDICSWTPNLTMRRVLATRKRRGERTMAARNELAAMKKKRKHRARSNDIRHAMGSDVNLSSMGGGRQFFLGAELMKKGR